MSLQAEEYIKQENSSHLSCTTCRNYEKAVYYIRCTVKAGFHQWWSHGQSLCNPKCRGIRSSENQTDVKLEAERRFSLSLSCWSGENNIVGFGSRNKPITMLDSSPCDWLFFPLMLLTFTGSYGTDWVVNWIWRSGNILILPTLIPLIIWLCLWTLIFYFHKHSYTSDSDYDANTCIPAL